MDTEAIKRTPLTATGFATVHPKRQNISFGRWAMPVMAQKMQDPDPLDRKRALQSLCDYVFDPRRVASKEFASVVPILKSLPEDENTEVKLKTAECFGAIAATAAGRLAYEKYDLHSSALKMVVDEDESVRYAAFIAIERVSLSPIGAESLVHAGAIGVLVRRMPEESDMNLVPLLQTLHHCCRLNFEEALKVDGLETLIPLLKRPSPKVRQLAATVIMDLTIERAGREHATKLPVILPLTDLCLDEEDSVKAKSLAALMMICIATKGKYQALENGALEKIIHLVKSDNVEVRLNAIKVLTTLGEAPEGRSELLKYYRMKLDIRLFLLVCHSLSLAFSLQGVPSKNTITSLTKSAEPIKQALSPQMIDTNDPDPNDPADGCRDISLHKCGSSMVRVFRLLDYLPWQKSYSAKCSLRKAFFSCMKTEDRPCKKRHWRTSDNRFRKKLARSLWSTRGCVLGALPNGTHI